MIDWEKSYQLAVGSSTYYCYYSSSISTSSSSATTVVVVLVLVELVWNCWNLTRCSSYSTALIETRNSEDHEGFFLPKKGIMFHG